MGPREIFQQAQAQAQTGDVTGALATLDKGIAQHPKDAALVHAAGKTHLQAGEPAKAAEFFAKAFALAPQQTNFAIDQANALGAAGNFGEARGVLAAIEAQMAGSALYASTRGYVERGAGDLAASARWYDKALALEPGRPKALQGRATVALERGEPDAVDRAEQALGTAPSDPFLWYGKAQALDVAGRVDEAREIAEMLVDKVPQWPEALKFLAQLRLAAGERDFTAHYRKAMARNPQDANIPMEWARHLAGLDLNKEAAEVMAKARRTFPQMQQLTLLHAIYLGAGGEDNEAETLFADLDLDSEDRWLHEARHAIRLGDIDRSHRTLDKAFDKNHDNIGAWALRDLCWRLREDPRHEWLHGQQGLVQLVPLRDANAVLPAAIERLHALHDGSAFPLGQSLRGGTQTRGLLFDRHETEFAALHGRIKDALEEYRATLPEADPDHPLLKHRSEGWRITGSWSVRLSHGGDFHTPHLHPEGIVSSACYLELPDDLGKDADDRAGWIELGRPAPDLRIDLPPIRAIEPKVGHLALFPSTLYHGTRPFGQGRRMTVAFDVTATQGPGS